MCVWAILKSLRHGDKVDFEMVDLTKQDSDKFLKKVAEAEKVRTGPIPTPKLTETINQFIRDQDGRNMIPTHVSFRLYDRRNSFKKSGREWALSAQFKDYQSWVIKIWGNKKPSDEEVEDVKKVVMRSFEFYHRHLQIPDFNMTID